MAAQQGGKNQITIEMSMCFQATGPLIKHLKAKHKLEEEAKVMGLFRPVLSERDKQELTDALAKFVALDYRPLNVVEGHGFLRLMKRAIPAFEVPSARTVGRRVLRLHGVVNDRGVSSGHVRRHHL
jgi:hypothetical protein